MIFKFRFLVTLKNRQPSLFSFLITPYLCDYFSPLEEVFRYSRNCYISPPDYLEVQHFNLYVPVPHVPCIQKYKGVPSVKVESLNQLDSYVNNMKAYTKLSKTEASNTILVYCTSTLIPLALGLIIYLPSVVYYQGC